MHKRPILGATALLLACYVMPTNACSWIGLSPTNVERELPERVADADTIVRARVISITNDGLSAQVKVIRAFKGKGNVLNLESGGPCAHIFEIGDEYIYFIKNSNVSSPDVERVSSWLVASIEKVTAKK